MAWCHWECYIKRMVPALLQDIISITKDFIMHLIKHISVLLCSLLQVTQAVTLDNANDGFITLQQWYNESTGLWIPSTGWWNSANCKQQPATINCNHSLIS
jgi:hypothetical protein